MQTEARFGSSDASVGLVNEGGLLFVKKSCPFRNSEKLRYQFDWLRERQHLPGIPRVVSHGREGSEFYYCMEYDPSFRPLLERIQEKSIEASQVMLERILDFVEERIHGPSRKASSVAMLERYVSDKLVGKLKSVGAENPEILRLLSARELVVNGRPLPGPLVSVSRVMGSPQMLRELSSFEIAPLHGDLTVENILVRGDEFLLLDPNGENWISDPVVDHAKLLQSLHSGYEFLVSPDYRAGVLVVENGISFREGRSLQFERLCGFLMAALARRLPPHRFRSLLFHEAVHFARLLPYRSSSDPRSAPMFFAVCARLLDDYVRQFECE